MQQAKQLTAANLKSVRVFNLCGEALLLEHVEPIFAILPDTCVLNTYGPTEAAITVTCQKLDGRSFRSACASSVSIGTPNEGVDVTLVGGSHADEGEIVISGAQLADGYWEDAEKTSTAFKDVEVGGAFERGYYTGDWAERREGKLYFKERIDFQVKIRGNRIELDEVAAAIRSCGWPVALVFKHGESLVAVVERSPTQLFDLPALQRTMLEKVERHAVPEMIFEIEKMPRNENDKLDRKAAALWLERTLAATPGR